MKEVTLKIKDNKFQFFMELIKSFDFVKVDEDDTKEDIMTNLKEGFKELKQYKKGKKEFSNAKDFLNEL